MKQLSDLLEEAKAEAPAPRYDVDDVIAAGRRSRRAAPPAWRRVGRRRGGHRGRGAALSGRRPPGDAHGPARRAGRVAVPGRAASTFAYAAGELPGTGADQVAADRRDGRDRRAAGPDGTVGSLMVYRPGVDPMTAYKWPPKLTDVEAVNGRKAFLIDIGTGPRTWRAPGNTPTTRWPW